MALHNLNKLERPDILQEEPWQCKSGAEAENRLTSVKRWKESFTLVKRLPMESSS